MTVIKSTLTLLLGCIVFILSCTDAKTRVKDGQVIIEILTVKFPYPVTETVNNSLHTYLSKSDTGTYEINYFDTIVVPIKNEQEFDIALKGYVAGKFSGERFQMHDITLKDTALGNIKGLYLTGFNNNTIEERQKFYCFFTIANSKCYWFFAFQPATLVTNRQPRNFFSSIQFSENEIPEAKFRINAFNKHKEVGQIWYPTPEFDYPIEIPPNQYADSTIPSKPLPPPAP